MSKRDLTEGIWFNIANQDEFNLVVQYGAKKKECSGNRVCEGGFVKPGPYLYLSYTERCARNCCYDDVGELIWKGYVATEVCEKMKELAELLKKSREPAPKPSGV